MIAGFALIAALLVGSTAGWGRMEDEAAKPTLKPSRRCPSPARAAR